MALAIAALLFVIFASNVVTGAMTGSPMLGDVFEMLILFAASIAFVTAILQREARSKAQ